MGNKPLLTNNQLAAKLKEIEDASHHVYSEAEVIKRIEEERKAAASMGKPSALTTRQKLMQQHTARASGEGGGAARPMKFQRNVLGQAIVAEHEE